MSEVKGTLLAIILAVSVFSVVFGVITLAMHQTSKTVRGKMIDSVEAEPDIPTDTSLVYTYGD